jgi:hypothetical protein
MLLVGEELRRTHTQREANKEACAFETALWASLYHGVLIGKSCKGFWNVFAHRMPGAILGTERNGFSDQVKRKLQEGISVSLLYGWN